jgi:spore coat protein U-like protein
MKLSNAIKSAFPAAVVGFLTLGFASTSAFAVTTVTATMAVSATVQATCVVSTTPMAFGTYTAVVSNSTATVSVTCTNTTPYTLGLNGGTTGTVTARVMKSGAVALGYGLFTDAAWTTNFATLASVNGTGSAQVTTVYGQIPAGQYVAPGAYADTITATVTY